MACSNSCNNEINKCDNNGGSNFVFVIVLFILLAIIIGSSITY